MASADPSPSGFTTQRRRPVALLLAIAAHVLVIWALIGLAPKQVPPPERAGPTTFTMLPDASPAPAPRPVARAAAAKAPRAVSVTPPAVTPPTPPPVPAPAPTPMAMLPGGMELFDSADIGKLGKADADEDDGKAEKSAAVYGPGEGPGGERMYDAQLLRAPTWAQIASYMPDRKPTSGYAIVACRVGEHNELENCRQLAESPPGTGFARAVRLAAWQFRIIPPRIGKRRLAYWVRVKLTVSELGPQ